MNGCRRAQQAGEVFWWAVVVVVVDFVSLLESFDASLVILQVIRLGDRTEGSFATTTESVKVMNVRDVLLLRVRLLLVVMMVPFGSDGYSDVGLGSTDGPQPGAVQSATADRRWLVGRTSEATTVVVVVIR